MRRLSLLLPLLLLAGCTPVDLTAAQVADKLQEQINELLEEVDKNLEEVADLDLDGLCANSGKITAGMDLFVPRYRAFAVLMEELETSSKHYRQVEPQISLHWMSKKSDATALTGPQLYQLALLSKFINRLT